MGDPNFGARRATYPQTSKTSDGGLVGNKRRVDLVEQLCISFFHLRGAGQNQRQNCFLEHYCRRYAMQVVLSSKRYLDWIAHWRLFQFSTVPSVLLLGSLVNAE